MTQRPRLGRECQPLRPLIQMRQQRIELRPQRDNNLGSNGHTPLSHANPHQTQLFISVSLAALVTATTLSASASASSSSAPLPQQQEAPAASKAPQHRDRGRDGTVTIYFTRHGQTLLNTLERVQGWSDAPLIVGTNPDGSALNARTLPFTVGKNLRP